MNNFGLKDRRNTPLPPLGLLPGDPNIPSMTSQYPQPGHPRDDRSQEGGYRDSSGSRSLYLATASSSPGARQNGFLTPDSGGQHDVISPGSTASGLNSGSSQSALSSISQYSSHHNSWSASAPTTSSSFSFSTQGQGPLATPQHYDSKPAYENGSSLYTLARPSPGSTTPGDPLTTPTYGHSHQHQYPGMFGHGGGGAGGGSGTLPSQVSTSAQQPPTPPSATAPPHGDPYSRPPPTPSYFSSASTPHQPSFSHQYQSPSAPSPTTSAGAPRGLHSLSGMAPPAAYRPYGYGHQMPVPSMGGGGAIMSNLSNPGGQMSVMPGLGGVHHGYGHPHLHGIYGHQAPPQTERPFKCDQCPQSFNRNHDLKRHKRIHLSVKPFPCGSCDKAFSRKDALKRHRLVKGCGDGKEDAGNNDTSGRSDVSASESPTITKTESS